MVKYKSGDTLQECLTDEWHDNPYIVRIEYAYQDKTWVFKSEKQVYESEK
jgi:hypothetical protein